MKSRNTNEVLEMTQLERKKDIYKALRNYILTLKGSVDITDGKEKKKVIKEIKKMAKLQRYFYNPEIKK